VPQGKTFGCKNNTEEIYQVTRSQYPLTPREVTSREALVHAGCLSGEILSWSREKQGEMTKI